MRRREFIGFLGAAAVASPLAARAQQDRFMRRIGILSATPENDSMVQARIAAFREELQNHGWVEGLNIRLDSRTASGNLELLRSYAQELVGLMPDVLFSTGTTPLTALQQATRTIPIVFAQVSDPVGLGFVSNVPRPSGNTTGFALFETGIAVKWLELLKELAPGTKRVTFIYDEANPASQKYLSVLETSASHFNVQVSGALVHNVDDIVQTITEFARQANGALIVMQVPVNSVHRGQIIELAARHNLPAVYFYRYYVAEGGLASYGVDIVDGYRRAASYVDRILRGAKIGELPVQFPTKFELVINLKTAKAIGLTIPPTLIARADEVIE